MFANLTNLVIEKSDGFSGASLELSFTLAIADGGEM